MVKGGPQFMSNLQDATIKEHVGESMRKFDCW